MLPYLRSVSFSVFIALIYITIAPITPVCAESNAQSLTTLLEQARNFRVAHKYEEALGVYDSILSQHPDNAIAHQEKGAVLASLNRYRDAISEENEALKLDPKLHLAHIYKGMIYCNKERNLDAYEEFKDALKIKPESFVVHMRLGLVCSRLKRKEEALEWYQKAANLIKDRSAPHLALSSVFIRTGDIDKAVEEANLAIKLEPTAVNYSNLGEIYSLINHLDEARENLKKALELDPEMVPAWVTLGRVFTLTGDYKEALEAYSRARKLSRRNKEAYTALGMLKDKSIHRVVVVDSSTDWVDSDQNKPGDGNHAPQIKIQLKNVSGIDLSGKTLYFRAVFENLKTGSKARARARVREDFPQGKTIEVELLSRKTLHFSGDPSGWPFVQCTINCRVGDVSSFQSQYILDRLMEKRIKKNAADPTSNL